MDYSGEGVSVYAEAKGEYTRQLCQYLTPALQKYFLEMLDMAKEREPDHKKHLISFQTLLEGISEWNIDKVQRETQRVAMSTQCDYLEELLTAVFIAHTKVLSAIRLTNKQKKLQITIPKLEHFMHRTITECARLLWKDVYLFASNGASIERQKNMRQIENLISEGILQGVRTMLPVKSILREYLATEESDAEVDVDDEEEEEEAEAEVEVEEKEPIKESAKEPTKEPAKEELPHKEPVKELVKVEKEVVAHVAAEKNTIEPISVPSRPPTPKLRPLTPPPELPATEDFGPKTTDTPPIVLDLSPRMNSIATSLSAFDKTEDDKPMNEIKDIDFDDIPFDTPKEDKEEKENKENEDEEIEFEEL